MMHTHFAPQRLAWMVAIALVGLLLAACTHRPVAYEYRSTPVEGWEPGDSLHFRIDTLRQSADYVLTLGLRSSSAVPYPFQSVWLVVTQQWHNPERTLRDTVECRLTSPDGDVEGTGVSIYQVEQPLRQLRLTEGSWADITIIHCMRREVLPGITNVGIRLERR